MSFTVDSDELKQLLIDEFKKQRRTPPKWIDFMVEVVKDRIERELEKYVYLPWSRRKQIVSMIVKDAVDAYIDAIDMIDTMRAELELQEQERRQRA